MKSMVEKATTAFKIQFSSLKAITGMNNEDIAKLLGCGITTVSRMYNNPFSVSGRYILMVQEYLRREEKKRNEA